VVFCSNHLSDTGAIDQGHNDTALAGDISRNANLGKTANSVTPSTSVLTSGSGGKSDAIGLGLNVSGSASQEFQRKGH
jgi:hypothetical protein